MKKAILLALASFFLYLSHAQENISGIINAYAAVQAINPCTNSLLVATTDGFAEGDALILIQMQGATIDVSNSAAYGAITGLGQAGLYERAVIATINGQEITLEKALLNEYDTDGAVQIVSIPDYPSGVTITNVLSAQAWDGSTGGLLALEASTITLQAPIDVSGKGFRGGSAVLDYTGDCFFTSNYDNFAYPASSIRGGRKGEGISAILSDRARGRGAQANGGGGGNDHNSGGGGGGNVNAGGQGGENDNPSFFGCNGNNPGQGGKAITGELTGRIFMGGGGGAGHGNNNVATDGGNGGGIVLLRAESITPNGFAILANGTSAETAGGDGAGGGGGGGTIVLSISDPDGAGLLLEARGGNGGNANNNNNDQCFGPGGGGAGGRIIRAGAAMATTTLAAGQSGLSINSSACGEGSNNAADGADGTAQPFEGLPEGDEDFVPFRTLDQPRDTSICTGLPFFIPAAVEGTGLSFQWLIDEGNGFTNLQSGSEYGPTNEPSLLFNSVTNAMDGNRYFLAFSNDCVAGMSNTFTLSVIPGPVADFTFTINGLQVSFDNTSANADGYSWDFGDGSSSNQFEPNHTFPGPGTYTVTLTATNDACSDDASFSTEVVLEQAPVAAFEPMPAAGCAPISVLFSNTSTGGTGTTFQWSFPGGSPATSTDGAPIVSYTNSGTFDVTLIATNSAGSDTLMATGAVQVGAAPMAAFTLVEDNLTINLANLSTGADSFLWEFGDGNTSTEADPTHTYGASGDYEVSLTVQNACGSDVMVMPVTVVQRPTPVFSTENPSAGCAPYTVYFTDESLGDYDSLRWSFPGGMPATSNIPGPEVVYNTPGQYAVQLTLFWEEGVETLEEPQSITILERPEPDFTFAVDGLTAAFTNLSVNATRYFWDFDDGTTSQEENPVHTFPGPGNYNVTLNASNEGRCSSADGRTVFILPNAVEGLALPDGVKLFPNPTAGNVRLHSEQPGWYPVQWRLFNAQGQVMASGTAAQDRQWDLGQWQAGSYLLQFFNAEGWWTVRVVRY